MASVQWRLWDLNAVKIGVHAEVRPVLVLGQSHDTQLIV